MKFAILHLSDMHFRSESKNNPILQRTEQIAAALRGLSEPQLDSLFVAVTGDIAFSGKEHEYSVALDFFLSLQESMAEFSLDSDKFVFIPGNHDCDHSRSNAVRQAIIRDTIRGEGGIDKIDDDIVAKCLEVQSEYLKFISLFPEASRTVDSGLYDEYSFAVNNANVIFRCFNTAWMSELEEKQGQLFFPIHLLDSYSYQDADVVISLLHHPFRWFESDNARSLEKHVEANTDLILTGHEHVHARYQKVSFDGHTNQYLEGAILQDLDGSDSGISAIVVDLDRSQHLTATWHWSGSSYRLSRQPRCISFGRDHRLSLLANTAEFTRHLHDLGTAFTHPRKDALVLEDLFIYPDLSCLSTSTLKSGKSTTLDDIVSSQTLIDEPRPEVLILGSDRSGKSTLAKALYLGFKSNGFKPLFLLGRAIKKACNEVALKRIIASAISDQYGVDVVEDYEQLPLGEKVLIVDDLQDAKINQSGQVTLLNNLRPRFAHIIVFAHESFFLDGLTQTKPEADGFISFSAFTLREMGHRLRGELIDRWMDLGQDHTTDEREFSQRVEAAESQIRALLGKNLLPSYPLFVLIILQTHESQQALNTASGSYGYYYETLITAALHNQSRTIPHDTIYTFVSSIAFAMFSEEILSLSGTKFNDLLDAYRKRHKVNPDKNQIRIVLQDARILVWDKTGSGRFQYKYIYYYFVAKYLAENLYRESAPSEIRALVSRLMKTLHVEEHANIVIFFLYLTKDEKSIKVLLSRAESLFDESLPCNFQGDLDFTKNLITEPPRMMLDDGTIKSHKEQHRGELDKSDDKLHEHLALEEEEQLEGVVKLNEAMKTLQIMGQVLRNFPGSLEGEIKVSIAKESYLLGLRVLGFFCTLVSSNLTDLREVFRELLREQGLSDSREIERLADFILYNMVAAVAFGMVKKISHSLGSEYLAETFQEVIDRRVPTSISLINLSIKLDHFKEFPLHDIMETYNDTHKNLFTSSIVRGMVLQHLYLFPVAQGTRQQVCDRLEIRIVDPKLITGEDRK